MENNSYLVISANLTNSSNQDDEKQENTETIVVKWLALLLLVGIIVLNTVVIILLFRRRKKSRMGFFVLNLAISDVCVGLFYVLPETLFNKFDARWTEVLCMGYYNFFSMMAIYVSTYAIVVITIDRLYVILKPLSTASKTSIYKYGLALTAWLIGGLLAIQYGVHGTYVMDGEERYCYHDLSGPKYPNYLHMLWFDLFILLVIPLTIIVTCYGIIIKKIHDRDKGGIIHTTDSYGNRHGFNSGHQNISKAKIKTVKLLLLVVIAYIVSWAPITIDAFMINYGVIPLSFLTNVLFTLSPLNSLANPLVFLLFNRKMFKQKNKKTTTTTATMKTKIDLSTSEQVVLISSSK